MQEYELQIWVIDRYTNKREKPNSRNTYWDDGALKTTQDCYELQYEIRLYVPAT